MGGNRVGKTRQLFNILTVWFLTGFWHGAEWNFIVWGLYFALFLTLEKFFFAKYLEKAKGLNHIYVLFFVAISFGIFSASGMTQALSALGGMFGAGGIPFISAEFVYNLRSFAPLLVIAAVGATPLVTTLKNKLPSKVCDVLEIPVLLVLLLIATAYLADGSFNPFLYFRF